MDRRSFCQVTLTTLAPLASPLTASQSKLPEPVSATHIEQVQRAATHISSLDNKFGGGVIRDIAEQTMRWSAGLMRARCPKHLRAELFASVSRLGIVVGASAFDSYAHEHATRTFKFAVSCAEEAKDWHLRAKAYSFLARQAVWTGQPELGLTHAENGLARPDQLTGTERAMLHTARARAFGKMGNVHSCHAAVGKADEAFAQARPSQDAAWMLYYDEAQHHGDTAHALFDLSILPGQDTSQAIRRFSTAVQGHSDAFKRSRAISRTKLAALIMANGDPREAAAAGHEAIDEAGRLTSRRAKDDLRQLGDLAAKHPNIGEATELRDRIAATLTV